MRKILGASSGSRPAGQAPSGLVGSRFDPAQSKSDFTVADVLAWARTKPAGETYSYSDDQRCALCQFLIETGRAVRPTLGPRVGWADLDSKDMARNLYPPEIEPALHSRTFGELAARLEKLCPTAPVPRSDWAKLDAYMLDIEQVSA